ncbi:MAG: cysteine--tRNA ligase [Candidatus Omnitrophica bacterium]|nr:cysteine--tRNA ligase [Candidatus Omnitrophota bacterium]
MALQIYDSLTNEKEEFKPEKANQVNMYTCGVTVYDECHIGHARSLYTFEVMRRYLKYRGFNVNFVRNITDVDDKIIDKAHQWAGRDKISLSDAFDRVRKYYIDDYCKDLKLLELPRADFEPLATENISQMQEYIQKLIKRGLAYEKDGNVYFSVRKFPSYGRLSGKKIDDLLTSVRIENDPLKADPLDFALWKKAKEEEPYWESPWGKGRPGWHIECSVMSQRFLKTDTLDIHGGGRDLIFPHHENERAQSEGATGKIFANFWIHHGLLTIAGQKMSKSLGNFVTIKDFIKKYKGADLLKLFFLSAHYAHPIDFNEEKIEEIKKAYERIEILLGKLEKTYGGKDITKVISGGAGEGGMLHFKQQFEKNMDDDFNMPKALAVLFDMVSRSNKLLESDEKYKDWMLRDAFEKIKEIANIFALNFLKEKSVKLSDEEIKEKIALRLKYKKEKNFKAADSIRNDLHKLGVIIEDNKDGNTTWRII